MSTAEDGEVEVRRQAKKEYQFTIIRRVSVPLQPFRVIEIRNFGVMKWRWCLKWSLNRKFGALLVSLKLHKLEKLVKLKG
ncbi:hypothetical protein L596_012450 [Steinernema carpocapsae]|uniref:Uncharacterized protein n=1 Tax=Steinernema carpocapsae TaxID=34508 RepID=A0A4U5NXZ3_STECR|nr:hypothetical protein L596_012450 [Steinernema carpocapsae]